MGLMPEDSTSVVPEGEIILSFNIVYPILFERVRASYGFCIIVRKLRILSHPKLMIELKLISLFC